MNFLNLFKNEKKNEQLSNVNEDINEEEKEKKLSTLELNNNMNNGNNNDDQINKDENINGYDNTIQVTNENDSQLEINNINMNEFNENNKSDINYVSQNLGDPNIVIKNNDNNTGKYFGHVTNNNNINVEQNNQFNNNFINGKNYSIQMASCTFLPEQNNLTLTNQNGKEINPNFNNVPSGTINDNNNNNNNNNNMSFYEHSENNEKKKKQKIKNHYINKMSNVNMNKEEYIYNSIKHNYINMNKINDNFSNDPNSIQYIPKKNILNNNSNIIQPYKKKKKNILTNNININMYENMRGNKSEMMNIPNLGQYDSYENYTEFSNVMNKNMFNNMNENNDLLQNDYMNNFRGPKGVNIDEIFMTHFLENDNFMDYNFLKSLDNSYNVNSNYVENKIKKEIKKSGQNGNDNDNNDVNNDVNNDDNNNSYSSSDDNSDDVNDEKKTDEYYYEKTLNFLNKEFNSNDIKNNNDRNIIEKTPYYKLINFEKKLATERKRVLNYYDQDKKQIYSNTIGKDKQFSHIYFNNEKYYDTKEILAYLLPYHTYYLDEVRIASYEEDENLSKQLDEEIKNIEQRIYKIKDSFYNLTNPSIAWSFNKIVHRTTSQFNDKKSNTKEVVDL
ncbi:conserved Plasmodium protein, unknown function [Plasmodium gaboni]|uniref:GLTSCR protein conserved domain-containing protein n=1 Tax=Plasmodium gaboni TaxID=647221 RepID=A0ABY1UHH4_9APIC|nr:conserved Plasmodium protein, unknown function [Plasmodium gaboni]